MHPVLLVLGLLLPSCYCQWSINGRFILKDGVPFTMKGMNFEPTPAGWPKDDYATNDWADVHAVHFPLLRQMNTNVIRVYNWRDEVVDGNDHTNFLDTAWNGGVQPIYVLVTLGFGYVYEGEKAEARARFQYHAEKYGNHPALMGIVIGNEMNGVNNIESEDFWRFINELGGIVHQYAPNILTSISVVDDGLNTVAKANLVEFEGGELPNLDFWGINSYRGRVDQGFDVLFDAYAAISLKPLIIAEFGCPASTRDENGDVVLMENNAEAQADYLEVHWIDIMNHHCIAQGGLVFVWTDEWWKAGNDLTHDAHAVQDGGYGAFPGGYWDEEWFGINGIAPVGPVSNARREPDEVIPRAAYDRLTALFAMDWTPNVTSTECTEVPQEIPTRIPTNRPVISPSLNCSATDLCLTFGANGNLLPLGMTGAGPYIIPTSATRWLTQTPLDEDEMLTFEMKEIDGQFLNQATRLMFFVNAGTDIGQAISYAISYDFDGDGRIDYNQIQGIFEVDDVADTVETIQWVAPVEALPEFTGGSFKFQVWSAFKTESTVLRVDGGVFRLPFKNLSAPKTSTPTMSPSSPNATDESVTKPVQKDSPAMIYVPSLLVIVFLIFSLVL